jgi:hypothetical protein
MGRQVASNSSAKISTRSMPKFKQAFFRKESALPGDFLLSIQ